MKKRDKIFDYLNKNNEKCKTALIKDIVEKFDVTEISAPIYYTQWKSYRKKVGLDVEIKEVLKPLDLEKSNINITLEEELEKFVEENSEFIHVVLNKNIENIIEKFWDSVQNKLNVISILGISTGDIYKGLDQHIKKMNNRGYVFKD